MPTFLGSLGPLDGELVAYICEKVENSKIGPVAISRASNKKPYAVLKQLNLWTSLCDDKINSRSFKDGEWNTRVRVTASIQLDQRLTRQALPSAGSGSPFRHAGIYDCSDRYSLAMRTESSNFEGSGKPAAEADDYYAFGSYLDRIRGANEDMSISGQFVLDRMWLGDGRGVPDLLIGDCISEITGRGYDLSASMAGGIVHPEIIQIIYLPEDQRMEIITRDLRFAAVVL